MSRKIKIKSLPQLGFGGTYGDQTPPTNRMISPRTGKKFKSTFDGMLPDVEIRKTLLPTEREKATLEAEKGETVVTNLQKEGIPEFYTIGGKRHSEGGTPLNLPPNSFIFSRDKAMALKGDAALAPFGKSGDREYTPAELSKQYDINFYRQILASPYSDKLQRETAEMMIKNYNLKLGALAIAQESIKGFEDGLPLIAVPYIEFMGIDPSEFLGMDPSRTSAPASQFKNGGEVLGRKRIAIKSLPTFQDGGALKTESKGTKQPPKGSVAWDPDAEGYDPSKVKVGHYVLKNGIWKKVTGFKAKPYEGKIYKDPNLGEYEVPYSILVNQFQDPTVRKAFYEQYKKEVDKLTPQYRLTQADIDKMKAMKENEVINNFLYKQKVNMAIGNKLGGLDKYDKDDLWDKNPDLANKTAVELGYKPFDTSQVGAFQAAYIGFINLKKENNELFKGFSPAQIGVYNDMVPGLNPDGSIPEHAISKVDGWDGNTTSGQIAWSGDPDQEPVYGDIEGEAGEEVDPQNLTPFEAAPPAEPAKWWTQDLTNLGQALRDRFLIPEIRPWQATSEFTEATPTFTDFRGQAARAQGMTNTLANANATFAGPQAQAATYAGLMQNMVDPMLQLQQAEIAANVGIANQFEMANTQARNAFGLQKAAEATSLWDKQAIYDQQMANTKRALEHNVVSAFNQGWTNRGMTQSMNTRTDQFKVDPRTGFTYYTGDTRKIKPAEGSQTTFSDQAAALKSQFPEMDWKDAINLAKLNAGLPVTDDENPAGLNAAAFMYPGYLGNQ